MNFLINYIYKAHQLYYSPVLFLDIVDNWERIPNTTTTTTPDATCEAIINDELRETIQMFFNIFQIIVPILILVLSAVDFLVAIAGSDDKKMKEATGKLVKRLLLAALFFLLPAILNMLLGWVDGNYSTCGIE